MKIGSLDHDVKSNYLVPYGSQNDANPDFDSLQVSTKGRGFFGTMKSFFFGRRGAPAGAPAKEYIGNNKYKNRTDIFTNEEIQIIQEVISRTQGGNYTSYASAAPRATKKSKKSKKSSSRSLTTSSAKTGVTSPKKKQARKAARRNASKSKSKK